MRLPVSICFTSLARKYAGPAIALVLALACMLGGCRRDTPPETAPEGPDYRALMEQSKQRREASTRYREVETALRTFHFELGRFPSNLHEVARAGFIEAIPAPPPGAAYSYDPVSGNLRIVRLPPDAQKPAPR